MTPSIATMSPEEWARTEASQDETGFGALRTTRGVLPLKSLDVQARVEGLLSLVSIRQTFQNAWNEPLEATYIFPLPDRAGVTAFRMEVAGRVVEGVVQERGKAREEYDQAIAAGHRAGIAEEERPGVFTLRVGNLPPGEQAKIELKLAGTLPFVEGEVTFRFPLVVAPRYIPGCALPGSGVGSGVAFDTDAVPDASRISPPVLLRGFPNPVRLSLAVEIHETLAAVDQVRSSLHAVIEDSRAGVRRIVLHPGERLDRDFILRYRLGDSSIATAASAHPESGSEGTFALTIVPPPVGPTTVLPRDVFFVLDRSGSMDGWKMVAARRALARMVDSLCDVDRLNIVAFDTELERPRGFPESGLVPAIDRNRFRAVEFLATIDARGGTELASPLQQAITTLAEGDSNRERILILVTDGQVGNEDQLLKVLGDRARGMHIVTVGIDKAVNESFLRRLAEFGGSRSWSECVESEDRLDNVMLSIQRRIGTPVLTELKLELESDGGSIKPDSLVPGRIPDLFTGIPLLFLGRYQGSAPAKVRLRAREASGQPWTHSVEVQVRVNPVIASVWARGQIRKLEDRYLVDRQNRVTLEGQIIALSERFGVLSRFTAFTAVDRAEVITAGSSLHRITQPVELPKGWPPVVSGPFRSRKMAAPRSPNPPGDATTPSVDWMLEEPLACGTEPPAVLPAAPPADLFQPGCVESSEKSKARRRYRHKERPSPPTAEAIETVRNLAGETLSAWRSLPRDEQGGFSLVLPELMVRLNGRLKDLIDVLFHLSGFGPRASELARARLEFELVWDNGERTGEPILRLFGKIEDVLALIAEEQPGSGSKPAAEEAKRGSFWKK